MLIILIKKFSKFSIYKKKSQNKIIINSIKTKATSLDFGDIGKISKIGQSVLSKLDSDFSMQNVMGYYFRYKDYTIKQNNVLSTANVLYSTHDASGAYILLPRGNNWNNIRNYVQQKINE